METTAAAAPACMVTEASTQPGWCPGQWPRWVVGEVTDVAPASSRAAVS